MANAVSSSQKTVTDDEITVRFIPIPLESLCLDTLVGFDIYIRTGAGKEPMLYRSANLPFTVEAKERLLKNYVARIYIERTDHEKYERYIEDNLDKIIADKTIEPDRKSQIVYSSATNLMERLFENPRLGENIRRGEKMVTNTVDYILRDERAFRSLLSVTSYDYYTYTHSVNVCVFSVALAQRTGMHDAHSLHVLGTGALLHDIGKSIIDKSIIGKKGPLDENEWVTIKKHPEYGVEMLRETATAPNECHVVVKGHHERLDGSGYPDGQKGESIHPYAKVVAIADVFDALTTKRSYKGAVGSFAALNIMRSEMSQGIDEDLFREFVLLMGA